MPLKARRQAFLHLVEQRGMAQAQASTVALALFPMGTNPAAVPRSRKFMEEIRYRADRFAQEARYLPGPAAKTAALWALNDYCRIASAHGERYYIGRFCTGQFG